MNELVILSLEPEYLRRVVEAGARVRDMRQFFLCRSSSPPACRRAARA